MTITSTIKRGEHRGELVEFGFADETGLQATRIVSVGFERTAFGSVAEDIAADCGLSVPRLLARIEREERARSRAAATLGRKGGAVRSQVKADAARENGKKGGRPRLS